jgi:hypothetical protein
VREMGCGASTAAPPEGAVSPTTSTVVAPHRWSDNSDGEWSKNAGGTRGSVVGALPEMSPKTKRTSHNPGFAESPISGDPALSPVFQESKPTEKYFEPIQPTSRRASMSLPKEMRRLSSDLSDSGPMSPGRSRGVTGARRQPRSSRGVSISEEVEESVQAAIASHADEAAAEAASQLIQSPTEPEPEPVPTNPGVGMPALTEEDEDASFGGGAGAATDAAPDAAAPDAGLPE